MWTSPLFKTATAAVLQAAEQAFSASVTGRAYREVQRELRGGRATGRLSRALDRYKGFGVNDALRELRGSQFANFAKEVEKFSKGDRETKKLLSQFLGDLGPAGKLIKTLTAASTGSQVDQLVRLLQAMGYEVLPPPSQRKRGDPFTERAMAASEEFLESLGGQVVHRDERPEKAPGRLPFGIPAYDQEGGLRGRIKLPMADGPPRGFNVDHPMVTGEMVDARSSNVHSYGYDIESAYLYVRFLGYLPGSKGPDGRPLRGGPGPLYRYRNVTPEEFLALLTAQSKGEWVWDELRIRGTWSGHKKDYELVGIEAGYVPRKATVGIDPESGRLRERFEQRRVRGVGGEWFVSALPSEWAGELPWGQLPDRGTPDRGAPDRGEPDRGR